MSGDLRPTVARIVLGVDDVDAAARTFAASFDIDFEQTTAAGAARSSGGYELVERRSESDDPIVAVVLAVDDLDQACVRMRSAGAQVIDETIVDGEREVAFDISFVGVPIVLRGRGSAATVHDVGAPQEG